LLFDRHTQSRAKSLTDLARAVRLTGGRLELRPPLTQFLGQFQRDLATLQHHAKSQPELGRLDTRLDTGQASILGRLRRDDRRLRKEQDPEGSVIVLRQFLRLADRGLEVAALPCLEPIGFHTEARGDRFGRVATLLACPREKGRIYLGYGRDGHCWEFRGLGLSRTSASPTSLSEETHP
jgi:hypothetical protein